MANSKYAAPHESHKENDTKLRRYEYVKTFERSDTLLPNTWIVVRIDGRGFHKSVLLTTLFPGSKAEYQRQKKDPCYTLHDYHG